jgi:hypothetical protein
MAIRYLHNGEDALKILRETDEDLWNPNIPDTSNLTLEEVKRKYPNLTWDEDIKIGGRLYREAVAYCESLNNQLEAPIQLSPIELELEKGVFTQWRRCHQNVNACIEKYGGYKKLGFIIRRLKYSALEGELHSVWVDSRGAFGEPGKILDVTPDNPIDYSALSTLKRASLQNLLMLSITQLLKVAIVLLRREY